MIASCGSSPSSSLGNASAGVKDLGLSGGVRVSGSSRASYVVPLDFLCSLVQNMCIPPNVTGTRLWDPSYQSSALLDLLRWDCYLRVRASGLRRLGFKF